MHTGLWSGARDQRSRSRRWVSLLKQVYCLPHMNSYVNLSRHRNIAMVPTATTFPTAVVTITTPKEGLAIFHQLGTAQTTSLSAPSASSPNGGYPNDQSTDIVGRNGQAQGRDSYVSSDATYGNFHGPSGNITNGNQYASSSTIPYGDSSAQQG